MLFNFYTGQLANALTDFLGYSLSDITSETYDLNEISGQDELGLLFKYDKEGNLFRLGFYMTIYRTAKWGKLPKMHIDYCDAKSRLDHRMKATSSQTVTFYSSDQKKIYKDVTLKICKNCLSLFQDKTSLNIKGRSFNDLLLDLEENDKTKCKVVDPNGYVVNWKQISRAFRESKKFKCENCFFQLLDMKYSSFIQTHHIDSYNKLNNTRSNLKCLCVKCHSEVDDYHRKQFSTFDKMILLQDFESYKKGSL